MTIKLNLTWLDLTQSPDIKPFENLWAELEQRLWARHKCSTRLMGKSSHRNTPKSCVKPSRKSGTISISINVYVLEWEVIKVPGVMVRCPNTLGSAHYNTQCWPLYRHLWLIFCTHPIIFLIFFYLSLKILSIVGFLAKLKKKTKELWNPKQFMKQLQLQFKTYIKWQHGIHGRSCIWWQIRIQNYCSELVIFRSNIGSKIEAGWFH